MHSNEYHHHVLLDEGFWVDDSDSELVFNASSFIHILIHVVSSVLVGFKLVS